LHGERLLHSHFARLPRRSLSRAKTPTTHFRKKRLRRCGLGWRCFRKHAARETIKRSDSSGSATSASARHHETLRGASWMCSEPMAFWCGGAPDLRKRCTAEAQCVPNQWISWKPFWQPFNGFLGNRFGNRCQTNGKVGSR